MSSYAAVPVAWRSCPHATVAEQADCPHCGGSGFAPIRWTVQLFPDGAQVGSHGSRGKAEAAARELNSAL